MKLGQFTQELNEVPTDLSVKTKPCFPLVYIYTYIYTLMCNVLFEEALYEICAETPSLSFLGKFNIEYTIENS